MWLKHKKFCYEAFAKKQNKRLSWYFKTRSAFLLYIWSIKNEYLENSMKNYFPFYLFIWNFFFVFNFINGIEKNHKSYKYTVFY